MTDLLRSNRELRADRIWNWTLPAWWVRVEGEIVRTCPNAGACAKVCYARNGTYNFPNVREAHLRNLRLVLDDPEGFVERMNAELTKPRFRDRGEPRTFQTSEPLVGDLWMTDWLDRGGAAVRIHDSGDFFSEAYLDLWLRVALNNPGILFYAYTKEVAMLKARTDLPQNLRIVFSKGGLQDHLIDDDTDRHADVFPSIDDLLAAGYSDQGPSDLLAVTLANNRVGIVANNIPHLRRIQGDRAFSEMGPR